MKEAAYFSWKLGLGRVLSAAQSTTFHSREGIQLTYSIEVALGQHLVGPRDVIRFGGSCCRPRSEHWRGPCDGPIRLQHQTLLLKAASKGFPFHNMGDEAPGSPTSSGGESLTALLEFELNGASPPGSPRSVQLTNGIPSNNAKRCATGQHEKSCSIAETLHAMMLSRQHVHGHAAGLMLRLQTQGHSSDLDQVYELPAHLL